MRIRRIELQNFVRYRGQHVLDLEPKVYGVDAREEHNAERSNWLGKSTLLEAVAFALYGWHRWPREDDWITKGEEEGAVQLECEGLVIRRSRKRGRSTQLVVNANGMQANQGDGQRLLERMIGLGEDDFFASCFFRQGQMGRFVTATSSQRIEILGGWFGLEKAEQAEELARTRLRHVMTEAGGWQKLVGDAMTFLVELGKDHGITIEEPSPSSVDQLVAHILEQAEQLGTEALKAKTKREGAEAQLREAELSQRDASDWQRVREINEEISKLEGPSDAMASMVDEARNNRDQTREIYRKAGEDVARLRILAHGRFDGTCPVDGHTCPDKDTINRGNAANAERLKIAEHGQKQAQDKAREAADILREHEESARLEERKRAKVEALRTEKQSRAPSAERYEKYHLPKGGVLNTDLWAGIVEQERSKERAVLVKKSEAERDARRARELLQKLSDAAARVEVLSASVSRWREAVLVLREARRRYSEGELEQIERGANALLVACSIPLVVTMRWQREAASGLAPYCDVCGAPFPASTKVKQCASCLAPRGSKVIQELDVVLSDRSGAAVDLAGVAIQLSAALWLRTRRTSAWSVAFLDEPFGSLDGANRKALATHVATMLRSEYGFEQAFVVAHQEGVVDAMPGRITVLGKGTDSTVEAVT